MLADRSPAGVQSSMALRMKWHLGQAVQQLGYEPVPMRLRAYVGGELALDTQHGVLVWEPRRIVPVYAVPEDDLLLAVEPTDPRPNYPTSTCSRTAADAFPRAKSFDTGGNWVSHLPTPPSLVASSSHQHAHCTIRRDSGLSPPLVCLGETVASSRVVYGPW